MTEETRDLRWPAVPDPAHGRTLVASAGTDAGAVRSVNEDAYLAAPPLFVVADGMGGYSRGDVASARVVAAFDGLRGVDQVTSDLVADCIAQSRRSIRELATDESAPGSTIVAAAFVTQGDIGYWLIAHEGDSRAYLWARGNLEQLTRDHSVVQELVDAGAIDADAARMHPDRHVVTRALGGKADSDPEFALVPALPGGRLLLCSDGLSSELSERSIGLILSQNPRSSDAVDALLEAAVRAGGRDNITVVVVDVLAEDSEVFADTLDTASRFIQDTLERIEDPKP